MDSVPVRVKGTQAEKETVSREESTTSRGRKKPGKVPFNLKKWSIIIAAVIILAAAGIGSWLWLGSQQSGAIENGKYQAVFFTSGQVYFGKLEKIDNNYMKLTKVFYIQASNSSSSTNSQNPQDAAKAQSSDLQLIKLGNEIHGPEDAMIISKDQILFFENLKTDGKVANTITQYYNKQQNK